MEHELRKAVFCIDGMNGRFKGYTLGDTWNGWASPKFTKSEAMRLMKAINRDLVGDLGGLKPEQAAHYDEATDTFLTYDVGAEEWEEWKAETVNGRKLYPIGAWAWIWDEYEPQTD